MSDFSTIKARIADEMRRGELSASATAVQNSVLSAIAYYERRRFSFNEFNDESITASGSVTYVPFTRMSVTPVVIDDPVKMVISSRDYPLRRRTFYQLASIDSGQWYGYPEYFAIHNKNFRLYPPPNDNYVLKIAGVKKLTEVSACATAAATNAWMTDGEEMIRCKAKADLFRDRLRNMAMSRAFRQEAEMHRRELQREMQAFAASGRVVPTRF